MEPSRPSIPDLRRQGLAVDFIENRLDVHHAAFATPPSRYDPDIGMFVIYTQQPQPASPLPACSINRHLNLSTQTTAAASDTAMTMTPATPTTTATERYTLPKRPLAEPAAVLKFWDSLFDRSMEKFKATYPKEPEEISIKCHSIRNKSTWTDVYDQLEGAKQGYCNIDKGFRAGFRKVYRKFADHGATPLQGAVNFVPDIDYVTPVLGAVQILLEAIKVASKVRAEILGAFEDIDMTFSQVELFLELFQGDENIDRHCVSLIASIFYAVECAIGFFLKSTWKRALSATFTAEEYQQKVIDGLSAINSQSVTLIQEASMSDMYGMSNAMNEVLSRTSQWNSHLEGLRRGQNQMQFTQTRMAQRQEILGHDARNQFHMLLAGCEYNIIQSQATQNEVQGLRRTTEHLTSLVHGLSRSTSPIPPSYSPHPPLPPPQQIHPQELLDWIDIPDLTSHDLEYMAERRDTRVPADEQARAQQLIQNRQFQDWLLSPTSSQLLVHGDYTGKQPFSGLSLLCASFIEALTARDSRFLYVVFFCGLHEDPLTDDYTGGRAIIESFICQLLCQYEFGAAVPASLVREELIRGGDIEALCAVFEWLVHQLPEGMVLVCIIDGAVYYERPCFQDDMGSVLVNILDMSDQQSTRAIVKVLVTSPTRTTEVRGPFPDSLILSMEAVTRSGMVASRAWLERQMGERLQDGVKLE